MENLRILLLVCEDLALMEFDLWGYQISLLNLIFADAAIGGIGWLVWKILERE